MRRAEQIELIHLEPTPAVVLARSFDPREFAAAIENGIGRVRAAVTAAQVPTAGAPFVRFVDLGDPLQVDIGIPLSGPHSVPTLRATVLPGGDAATIWLEGRLDGLLAGVERLLDEIDVPTAGSPWAKILPGAGEVAGAFHIVCPVKAQ